MRHGWRALAKSYAGKVKLALIVPLGLALVAAGGDTVPQVTLATPGSSGTGDGTITRFTLRFSEDMVPLGDPRAPAPATNELDLRSHDVVVVDLRPADPRQVLAVKIDVRVH